MEKKVPIEILLEIFGNVLGTLGVSLAIVGLIFQYNFPWITFEKWWTVPQPAPRPWRLVYYQISPFIIRYHPEGDVSSYQWFYKIDATAIGVTCFVGGIIGLIGVLKKMRKTNLVGGILVMFSLIAFGTSLPGLYPSMAWGMGARFTFYGSLSIMTSALISYTKDFLQKNRLRKREIEFSWSTKQVHKESVN